MSMTIGRAAINEDPYGGSIRQSGDVLSFDSSIIGANVDEMKARIQQLSGLVDNQDEEIIPFTWTEDPTLDGFYRVRGLSLDPVSVSLTTGECPFSITLQRVPYFAKPQFETLVDTVVRTNGHGVVAPVGVAFGYYTPSVYYESDAVQVIAPAATGTLTTEDGAVGWGTVVAPLFSTRPWHLFVRPSDYYKGSARVEVKYGSTWYPIHGGQVPANVGLNWRISNGYTRLAPSLNGSAYYLRVETYRAGSWVGQEYAAGYYPGGVFSALYDLTGTTGFGAADPTVFVNTPEFVSVRAGFSIAGYPNVYSLRAIDTFAEVKIPNFTTWGIVRSTNEAGTGFAGGVRATANDANGLRYLISTATTSVTDTTKGAITSGASGTMASYQITADYQAGIATTPTTVRDLFYAARSERRTVVSL